MLLGPWQQQEEETAETTPARQQNRVENQQHLLLPRSKSWPPAGESGRESRAQQRVNKTTSESGREFRRLANEPVERVFASAARTPNLPESSWRRSSTSLRCCANTPNACRRRRELVRRRETERDFEIGRAAVGWRSKKHFFWARGGRHAPGGCAPDRSQICCSWSG